MKMGTKPTPRGTAYAPMSAKPTIASSASIRSLLGDIDPPASLPSEVAVAAAVAGRTGGILVATETGIASAADAMGISGSPGPSGAIPTWATASARTVYSATPAAPGACVCVPELRTAGASGSVGGTELARHVITGTLVTGGTSSPSKPDETALAERADARGPTSDGHADEPREPDTHVHIEQGQACEPPAGAQDLAPTVLSVTGLQAAALTPTPAEVLTTPRPEPAEKRGATSLTTVSNEAGANSPNAANGDADGSLPKKKEARPSRCVPSAEASPLGCTVRPQRCDLQRKRTWCSCLFRARSDKTER